MLARCLERRKFKWVTESSRRAASSECIHGNTPHRPCLAIPGTLAEEHPEATSAVPDLKERVARLAANIITIGSNPA